MVTYGSGVAPDTLLVGGEYYRFTLGQGTAEWLRAVFFQLGFDSALERFEREARRLWERVAETGLAFSVSPAPAGLSGPSAILDVRIATGKRIAGVRLGELVAKLESLSSYSLVAAVARLPRPGLSPSTAPAARQQAATAQVERQGGPLDGLFTGLKRFWIAVVVVGVLVIVALWVARRRGAGA